MRASLTAANAAGLPEQAPAPGARPRTKAASAAAHGHHLNALRISPLPPPPAPPTARPAAAAQSASLATGSRVVQLFPFGHLFGDRRGKLAGAATALGTAALIGGVVAAAPLAIVGGAAAALLGGGFLARRQVKENSAKLVIPLGESEQAIREEAGSDPNIWFRDNHLYTSYSGQQLRDQYSVASRGASSLFSQLRQLNPNEESISSAAPSLNRTFGKRGFVARQQRERQALTERAQRRTRRFDFETARRREEQRSRGLGRSLEESRSGLGDAQSLLEGQEGIAFGEDHSQHHTKAFLTHNLGSLRDSGVNTLYLEAIRSDYQEHVDRYLQNREDRMSPELERYVTAMDRTHGADPQGAGSLRQLLGAARQHGVRVRGIDSVAAASPETSERGSEPIRDVLMNTFGEETIRQDSRARGPRSKYVILAGRAHNVEQEGTEFSRKQGFEGRIPGFSQLLDIPAVQVHPETGRLRLDRGEPEEDKKHQ